MQEYDEQIICEYELCLTDWIERYNADTTELSKGVAKGLSMALQQFRESNTGESMDGQLVSHCNHYWIKLTPLDPYKQKYMCLNCDEVKG